MSIVLGYDQQAGGRTVFAQDGPEVAVCAPDREAVIPPVIERRNGVIGNGPTKGGGVFDFRYGPFTSGYPEAGVVHYYTYGERILSVEVDLSGKHRGIERSLAGLETGDAVDRVARVCGNFAVAHTLAFCRAVESALSVRVGEEHRRLRITALEIERVYNHLYVVMRLAAAAAQKVLAAHLAALFEEAFRVTELVSGRRGGSPVVFGGFCGRQPPTADWLSEAARRVDRIRSAFRTLYARSLDSRNYLDRLHGTAVVSQSIARNASLTGPSLRACGVGWDIRAGEPLLKEFQARTRLEADSFARMEVRAEEIVDSCSIVIDQASRLTRGGAIPGSTPDGEGSEKTAEPSTGLGVAESPSGTVAWLVTAAEGRIVRAVASTPSVFGFQAYADSVTGNIFTDVPFAIESFGLSFADAGR